MLHKQLTFAREFRGLSQTDLANRIEGLSQSNLSKYEKGYGVLSEEIIEKIINYLEFPKEFYFKKINFSIENANYRKKSGISQSTIDKFENRCKIIGFIIDEFSQSIEWPPFNFHHLNVEEGYTPKYIAHYNRKKLKLERHSPVKNIIGLLENNGIIVYEIDDNEKFDGLSFFTEKGVPIIIINKNFSNDRKRYTLAHELGHLLLHNEGIYPITTYRDKEKEANEFASEFLMPEEDIKESLRNLKFSDLAGLKMYWLTSMSSIIRRASDLNFINENKYKYFMIEMSRCGFLREEPVNVFIDKPSLFRESYKLFKDELGYTTEDFINYLTLPADILTDFFSLSSFSKLTIIK